jgi:pimeloyl-ACP methyl ester carboxylesterase
MAAAGEAELRAAAEGRSALEQRLESSEFDMEQFTSADQAALRGVWAWLGVVAGKGMEGGIGGMVDDDLAYVTPWGFEPSDVVSPVLLLQGGQDRIVPSSHGEWLARHIHAAQLWRRPEDGHISVLSAAEAALDWLIDHAIA